MAISSDLSSVEFLGNGSPSTPYTIPFRFDDPAWLSVAKIDADGVAYAMTLGIDFEIEGNQLTTTTALLTDVTLRVLRSTPVRQTLNTSSAEQSYTAALEEQLDQTTMALQDLARNNSLEAAQEILQEANEAAASAASNAASATESAAAAASNSTDAGASAMAASGSAAQAASYFPPLPGPYADGKAAIEADVAIGFPFYKPDFSTAVARYPASVVALFGDSITNFSTSYSFAVRVTDSGGYGLLYNIRAVVPNSHLVTVTHVNPGGTGGLTVSMTGSDLVVTLARSGGVITSTIADVRTAVIAAYGDRFIVNLFVTGSELAIAQAKTWALPASYNAANAPFIWAQAMMYQRFDLARRTIQSGYQYQNSTEGDWDFGYPGHRADDLLLNPGPLGDVLASNADLIIGNAGANDLLQGASAATTRDRIVALWDALSLAKRQFVWLEVPPSGTPALQSVSQSVNSLLRPLAAARRIPLIPWKPSFVSAGAATTFYFPDGTHPSDAAGFEQGAYMLPYLDAFIQPVRPDYGNSSDPAWLTANSRMTGSTSGIATGWINNSPSSITPSKITATDGGNDWQQLAIVQGSGVYSDAAFSSPFGTSGFAVGDVVEAVVEVVCSPSGIDMKALIASIYFSGASSAPLQNAMIGYSYDSLSWQSTAKPLVGVIRTPPCVIPHGTTGVNFTLRIEGSGTLKFRNAGIRKSTQPN